MAMATKSCVGLGSASLRPRVAVTKARRSVAVRAAPRVVASGEGFDQNWLKANPLVTVLGVVGWTVPSSIPVGGFDGSSLFGKFTESIGQELAHFPQGPALADEFWLLMITWHVGLFTTMTLAQIGYQGRQQGYFK